MFAILLLGATYPLFSWLHLVIVSQKIPLHQNISTRESVSKCCSFFTVSESWYADGDCQYSKHDLA